ncbi:hypothetical protein CH338_16125, partial [Rhodoplanes elegans]
MTASSTTPVHTTCPYCGVGCGVVATPDGQGGLAIAGDPEHPANAGRLCSKGAALGETLSLSTRLLHPEVDGRRTRGTRLIVLDPRRTATAEEADRHLAIAPGQDTVLFAYLLTQIAEIGALDRAFIAAHTTGFDETLARAREIAPSLATVAARTGLSDGEVSAFVTAWRDTEKVVTVYSQGVNQSAQGTDKVTGIVACHLATGRIGKPGTGPLSFTGQPNAMGGREVGGLANMLAAHMGFALAEIDRVRRFWGAPHIVTGEGLKAVDLFDAVADGRIKALWVMGTNPAVSLPRADAVQAALEKLELLIVSENVASNDTLAAGAHIRLPAAAWSEKDGTVTNSERRISRQRAVLSLPGETKPDWWIMSRVAARLGHAAAFAYTGPAAIFREHAALSGFENDGARAFDIAGLADLTDSEYDALAPVQWPVLRGTRAGTARLFGDGGFVTADRRARFVPAAMLKAVHQDLGITMPHDNKNSGQA